jgi:hypothetical protein
MPARLLVVLLCAALTLPLAAVTPPAHANPQAPDSTALDLAAKSKKKKKKPKFTTVTRTVRETVTRTFSNPAAITTPSIGNATLYPSRIAVSGLTNGVITDVNLTLNGANSTAFNDLDLLLAPAHLPGRLAVVMSDTGNEDDQINDNLVLTLDDSAAAPLPSGGKLTSGTFRPTNIESAPGDVWSGTALTNPSAPSANPTLAVFNGADPNGSWELFATDDTQARFSDIKGGWSLTITAQVDTQITEQVPVAAKAKKKKKK